MPTSTKTMVAEARRVLTDEGGYLGKTAVMLAEVLVELGGDEPKERDAVLALFGRIVRAASV